MMTSLTTDLFFRFHAFTWSTMTFSGSESNFQIFRLPTHSGLQNYMQEFVNGSNTLMHSWAIITCMLFITQLKIQNVLI